VLCARPVAHHRRLKGDGAPHWEGVSRGEGVCCTGVIARRRGSLPPEAVGARREVGRAVVGTGKCREVAGARLPHSQRLPFHLRRGEELRPDRRGCIPTPSARDRAQRRVLDADDVARGCEGRQAHLVVVHRQELGEKVVELATEGGRKPGLYESLR